MGQGFSLTTLSAGSAGIDVLELADLTYERSLGTARFMKSIRARHRHGLVVVKVAMKPFPAFDLSQYVKAIRRERDALADVPNALGYQRVLETSTSGYLVRQYLYSSLYDRMSTRPFLEDIEKKWLSFQLLCALRDCHARNVYHGDIKTENILVTSWTWLYLTDFSSSFKKTYLPEDNPADFSYFFDTSGRRTCYLAPERFVGIGEQDDGRGVTWAMDIFSAGCVIAELFVEAPIFSLSQLFKYRRGEYDPELAHLSKIEDLDIRELVTHMIQVEPESRYSAEEYLNFWRRKAFPEYFYSFLHQYMGLITDPSSGRAAVMPESTNFGEADDRIDRVYYDFDKISYFLGYENEKTNKDMSATSGYWSGDIIPIQIDIPNNRHLATGAGRQPVDDGTLIFLTLVVSALRNTARSTARLRACDLMLAFGERITDEAKLDRVLPYVVSLLNDRSDLVKITALRTIAQLLSLINVVSPINAYVFTEYVRPRLQHMISGPGKVKPVVRATYASCLATLAHTSSKILEMVQALRADGSIPTIDPEAEDGEATDLAYQNLFDVARLDLVEHFESHTKALLTDSDLAVRRAFLSSVSSLCVFFGSSKANDLILSHLNTYLNDTDWMLKCVFFQTIVGVATFIGGLNLEEFILPLMLQALTDPEEFVVERVLSSLASIAELGLFQRSKTWEIVDVVSRFMVHPNLWIREAAVHFVSSATRFLSFADTHCIILVLIQPYMKVQVTDLSELRIFDALKKPLPRPIMEMTASWATRTERGLFWKQAQQQKTFSFSGSDHTLQTISSKDLTPDSLRKMQKNEEDEQWLTRLRNLGMTFEHEVKLIALRDYIGHMAQKRPKEGDGNIPSRLNNLVKLKEISVTPRTVFFENKKQEKPRRRLSLGDEPSRKARKEPHTISDALLDASTTIDDQSIHRKKPRAHDRKDTLNDHSSLQAPRLGFSDSRQSSNLSSPLSSSPGTRQVSRDSSTIPARDELTGRLQKTSTGGNAFGGSEGTVTPTGSLGGGRKSPSDGTRHKPSAFNLLNRRDTSKTAAQISTTPTTAVGRLDGPFTPASLITSPAAPNQNGKTKIEPGVQVRTGHTYEGGDPNVNKLLDSLASENYPVDVVEFGPLVTPASRRRGLKKNDTLEGNVPWRPQGILVATFSEHTGSINRVLPSPDHVFFLTASDDGSVKIWDTLRLERNLAQRSRQTHRHQQGAKVVCVTFVENTHTFISCASDGSVHAVKVDYIHSGDTSKYGKLSLVRTYQLPEGEHAICVHQFKLEAKSVLILATNLCRVIALDLRTMAILYAFENPIHHGIPTCFVVDNKHHWLLLASSHGILDLWDLRFRLCLKSWGLMGGLPIQRMCIHPFKGRGRWVCVAGGTSPSDVTLWDIERMQCREVYRIGGGSGGNKEDLRIYDAWKVDEGKPERMLNHFARGPEQEPNAGPGGGIRAMCIGVDTPEDGREAKYGFLITCGTDRKIRFWDLARVEASMVVSGLDVEERQPQYTASHPTTALALHTERVSQSGPSAPNAGSGTKKAQSNMAAKRGSGRPPRSKLISMQQQQLLRSHLDTIMDVALLETPVGMTVSVDRSGVIYVFQ